ncbi:hypothetical protein [Candidatus Albibeggiatoa sp. nov. NOAA]|uniref:hypothetical protein n=1 Tax=Candidatus Albibeggiatoa sp. nov. NOAA TaxID=3162724 RepID=UPI0032FF1DA4|nr:hypothetical protein [Thiotrichaceae bacterium]
MKVPTTRVRPNFKNVHELAIWNPISYIILLYWILCQPKHLFEHQRIFRNNVYKRIIGWLISHSIILPLLFISICLAMHWLPISEWAWSSQAYFTISALLGVVWLLLGCFASEPDIQDKPYLIGMYVLLVYSCFIATLGIVVGLNLPPIYSILLIALPSISSGVALGIAGSLRFDFIELVLEVVHAFAHYAMCYSRKKSKQWDNDLFDKPNAPMTGAMTVAAATFGVAFMIATKLTRRIQANLVKRAASKITRYIFVISLLSYGIVWIILLSFVTI